jgi:amidase
MSSDPHEPSAEVAALGAGELVERMEAGTLTSRDAVEALLARIASLDDPEGDIGLRSIASLAPDALHVAAERDAERAQGRVRGPLHGVPVVVKDNIEVAGHPATAGSTALVGRPSRDAALVTRLREAGAVVLATTNLSEWANIRSPRATSGWSATGGLVGNPWALDRSAGGSSAGSGAALAAGFAPLAVGTETDSSIVCPASVNGVVGLKPTVGAVPTEGVVPISASQDSPGPMARCVDDVALLFGVLSGQRVPAPGGPVARMAFATSWRTGHDPTDDLVDRVVARLQRRDAPVIERWVATPNLAEYNDELTVLLTEFVDDLATYLAGRPGAGVQTLADVIAFEQAHAATELAHFGHEQFLVAVETGGRAGAAYAAVRERNLHWAVTTCLEPALADVDVLIAPAWGPAWKSDLVVGGHANTVASCATMPAAVAGWPIASVPIGLVGGLPVGMALIARPGGEWILLDAARRIEALVAATDPLPPPAWSRPQRG